jgi:chromosome segregation ATPase
MFKSPVSKLVRFFQKSRNGWKAKCQEAKRENKKLATQTRAVEKSRDRWKHEARTARRRIRELEQQMERLKCSAAPSPQSVFAG